jgi:hypothetical protein
MVATGSAAAAVKIRRPPRLIGAGLDRAEPLAAKTLTLGSTPPRCGSMTCHSPACTVAGRHLCGGTAVSALLVKIPRLLSTRTSVLGLVGKMMSSSPREGIRFFVTILFVCTLGCGQAGPKRVRVSGAVTYAGQPVELGRIIFEPDTSHGNRGPEGFAPIENGRFDTASPHSKGPVPGATIVRIEGLRLADSQDVASSGRAMFSTYEERVDVPQADLVKDFVVPTSSK